MFVLSLVLVIISSYLILSFIYSRYDTKRFPAFLYLLLIIFSQIVLTFEILSLFKSISQVGVIAFNILFLITGLILKKNLYIPKIELQPLFNAVKRDKFLAVLCGCFIIFLTAQFIIAAFAPVKFGDALNYYLPRCTMWIQQGTILHYITPDTRELIMPVNMEFLYTWFLLLKKTEVGCACFSYMSFIAGVYVLFNFLRETGCSIRRSLWSVFVFASFALAAVEMVNPSSDLFAGVLILSSCYLFLLHNKYNDKISLIFSSAALALAAGTKTTCLMTVPALVFLFFVISFLYAKPKMKSILTKFTILFAGFFIIFSSYNYILNFIQFLNPLSDKPQILIHQLRGGFKGFICNIIKYFFVFFDTSGINTIIDFNGFITSLQTAVLGLIGETADSYTSNWFGKYFLFNPRMTIQSSALGIMGLWAFLPSLIKTVIRFFKKQKSKKTILYAALSAVLFINICTLAGTMVFAQYNIRYLLTFTVISLPVASFSYIKKNKSFCKILMCFFIFIYLVVNPLNLLFHQEKNGISRFSQIQTEEFLVFDYIKNFDKANRIAMVSPQDRMPVYHIEKLRLHGFKIDKLLLENIETYDLSKYKYIITSKLDIVSTCIVKRPSSENSRCLYYDKGQNIITSDDKIPVMTACEPQINYFTKNGFQIIYNGGHYVILERQSF